MNAASGLRTGTALVVEVVRLVLVDPVRQGRLRGAGWPPGLRAIVVLTLAAFASAAGLVLAAPVVRRHGALTVAVGGDLIYPRWTTAVFLSLTVLTLALLHAASLHLTPWLRVAVLVVVVLGVTGSVLDTVDDNLAANVVSWVGAGLLALLTAVRWRASFHWWEFVASLVLVGGTLGVVMRLVARHAQPFGLDTAPVVLTLDMQLIAGLAVPFSFVAGLAFAQLSVLLAHRVGDVVDERVRPVTLVAVVVAMLAAVDLALAARHLGRPTDSGAVHLHEWVSSAVLLAVALGVAVVVGRGTDRPAAHGLDRLKDAVSALALPVGLAVTATAVASLVVTRLDTVLLHTTGTERLRLSDVAEQLSGTDAVTWTRVGIGCALVAWGAWRRRASPLLSVLAATIGVTLVVTMARNVTDGRADLAWTSESLTDVAAAVTTVVLVGLTVAGRVTRRRLLALGIALGLSLAFSVRSTFDAPFVAVFGLGATAAVFLGVLWATLTDAEETNADSTRYPRPARVLFFLANAQLAMTTLAFLSVASTDTLGLDLGPFATLGDDYLGTGLLLTAYSVLAWEVATAGKG